MLKSIREKSHLPSVGDARGVFSVYPEAFSVVVLFIPVASATLRTAGEEDVILL